MTTTRSGLPPRGEGPGCVIDTDPGLDDAIAILAACNCGLLDIHGVTTVAGNIGIERTTRNALDLLHLAGRADIPVAAGAGGVTGTGIAGAAAIHGDDGLGGVALPRSPQARLPVEVAEFLSAVGDVGETDFDLLALGPLTNVAALVEERPAVLSRVRRIIAMGGALHEPGNVSPRAEFNFAFDPEAAATVLESGVSVLLVPLDVTRKLRADREFVRQCRALATPVGVAVADLIEAYFAATQDRRDARSRPLHDPCVILLALWPELFDIRAMELSVDTAPGPDRGALVAGGDRAAPAEIALDIDAAAARERLLGMLGG